MPKGNPAGYNKKKLKEKKAKLTKKVLDLLKPPPAPEKALNLPEEE